MADIKNPIAYSPEIRKMVDAKLADPTFNHTNWGDDDLADFRKLVRDYYRTVQVDTCAFCKGPLSSQSALNCHVEHIVPKSLRREFIFEPKNFCAICADCNEIKRSKETEATEPDPLSRGKHVKQYPRSSGAFLIVHPHFDDWDLHLIKFGALYLDLSDKGVFTIGACNLNRKLRKFGWEAVIVDDATLREAAEKWLNTRDPIAAARSLQALRRLLVII
ncbi:MULTISPECIES: HNH endonuclease [Burkholderia]|uniref:HNH endonuclease n=1 Tax=Burkholderia sola TaxID=2843302 RepID=A0ABV2C3G2_9BURK|nr:hypothetical protein [Burkholderia sp. CpTa8-5]MBP0605728.1 hypothetical protein [Burkholderia sp. CpTa8-5]